MLVSIEGIDGAGKTTLIKQFANRDILITREPTDYCTGRLARELALAPLFLLDHYVHLLFCIVPALLQGRVIVTDRYYDSYNAYLLAKDKSAATLRTIVPDYTILLTIDPAIAYERKHEYSVDYLTRVQDIYLEIAEQEPDRFIVCHDTEQAKRALSDKIADY